MIGERTLPEIAAVRIDLVNNNPVTPLTYHLLGNYAVSRLFKRVIQVRQIHQAQSNNDLDNWYEEMCNCIKLAATNKMMFGEVILHVLDPIHNFVSAYNDRVHVVESWDISKSEPLKWVLGKNEWNGTAYIVLYSMLNSEARNLCKDFQSSTTNAWTVLWTSINKEGATVGTVDSHLTHTTVLNETVDMLLRFDSQHLATERNVQS